MKTKNLLQSFILILALCVMNQLAMGQCNANKIYMCRVYSCPTHKCSQQTCRQVKCVSPNQVQNYLAAGWSYGPCSTINCNSPLRIEDPNIIKPLMLSVYPNPISYSTTISFALSRSEKISLKVFDVSGRLISTLADNIYEEGNNEITWNADEVKTGVYFLQMQTGENLMTEKLIVAK